MFDRNKKSLTELISIHAAALADAKAKEEIWWDAFIAHSEAIANLSRFDAVTVNSDATLQRIRILKQDADTTWKTYYSAKRYVDKTLVAISA